MNGVMVCKADASFAVHASVQLDACGTGVAQVPQCETGTSDCQADQTEPVASDKAAGSFEG